jgi:hypothetical protein
LPAIRTGIRSSARTVSRYRTDAAPWRLFQAKNPGITEIVEISGRGHPLNGTSIGNGHRLMQDSRI